MRTVGLIEEDSDEGIVHQVLSDDVVLVGWDSGVTTPCAVENIEVAS